jgi:hypothetical protein
MPTEKAIAAIQKLGADATIDAKLDPAAPIAVQFERATDADIIKVSRMPQVGAIAVFRADKLTPQAIFALKNLPKLQQLTLGSSVLGDIIANTLGALPALRSLSLAESKLTDQAMPSLAKSNTLQLLDLSNSKIGDRGAAALATIATLQEVNLTGTKLTDAGIGKLATATALTKLTAIRTNVTRTGAEAAEKAKPGLTIRY